MMDSSKPLCSPIISPPNQLSYTVDDVDQQRVHCSLINYVKVPDGYSVALGQDSKLHLYDPQDNVRAVSTLKMFDDWWDIESPMGHIGTRSVGKYLVSSRSSKRALSNCCHPYAERDDDETGEHWIDIEIHAMPQSIERGWAVNTNSTARAKPRAK